MAGRKKLSCDTPLEKSFPKKKTRQLESPRDPAFLRSQMETEGKKTLEVHGTGQGQGTKRGTRGKQRGGWGNEIGSAVHAGTAKTVVEWGVMGERQIENQEERTKGTPGDERKSRWGLTED